MIDVENSKVSAIHIGVSIVIIVTAAWILWGKNAAILTAGVVGARVVIITNIFITGTIIRITVLIAVKAETAFNIYEITHPVQIAIVKAGDKQFTIALVIAVTASYPQQVLQSSGNREFKLRLVAAGIIITENSR
jgi:hypothetical protein